MSYLNKLSEPWLSLKNVERTTRRSKNVIHIELTRTTDNLAIDLAIPDFAGEDFASVITSQTEFISSWEDKPDALLFFIKDLPTHVLPEQVGEREEAGGMQPAFTTDNISVDVQNALLLKELRRLFPWKKLAIGISAWDEKDETMSPKEYISKKSPFLNNFIEHYFPDAFIFGVSSQGAKYLDDSNPDKKAEQEKKLLDDTRHGKRAYIVTDKKQTSYDLTLPINFLI